MYGGYIVRHGREYYSIELDLDNKTLVFCKEYEEVASRRKKYSRQIDSLIKRIRIQRKIPEACFKIKLPSVKEILLRKDNLNNEVLLVIKHSSEVTIVHYPLYKYHRVKKFVNRVKKLIGFQ